MQEKYFADLLTLFQNKEWNRKQDYFFLGLMESLVWYKL